MGGPPIDPTKPVGPDSGQLPQPPLVAEDGFGTSEFKALLGLFAFSLINLLIAFDVLHLTDSEKAAVMEATTAVLALAVSVYAAVRNYRKRGTSG